MPKPERSGGKPRGLAQSKSWLGLEPPQATRSVLECGQASAALNAGNGRRNLRDGLVGLKPSGRSPLVPRLGALGQTAA